ncbi:hypothetical protein GCM10007415_22890 [Parapedobacter pyrenivorans]|uniref:AAA domain-containing protein n=1 Tax=Parapedobacter pyrenivorans TaxID=1305674 RepID=A0A917HRN7_9SPHI|nr:hypothetical protein [Parapedobacter pyrenivorans]GGG88299.1 hypothetical protein GCM10007415_22890 [Parapedobacter pyrenivorans]
MGSLIINKVKYFGDNYFYESPDLHPGVNIILGDNGSGKSTFSYFIEYALGGKIKPFTDDDAEGRYSLILNDKNNYVHLDLSINGIAYSFKRFINSSDIFIDQPSGTQSFPLDRKSASFIFSDWLLEKLEIPVFELYLGGSHWYFNFNDLFRLLNYDQNTEPRKIYKAPLAENFVADSIIIRKSIFEILLGISSADYFKKIDKARAAMKHRDLAKALWENFTANHEVNGDFEKLSLRKTEIESTLATLEAERKGHLKENTTVDDKMGELAQVQSILVDLELKLSQDRVAIGALENEKAKIDILHAGLVQEIAQIEKIIFTHEKLDLFAMELCPFCMTKKDVVEGYCICGSKFNDDDYEKFVYNANEYKDILSHKQKSIKAINLGKAAYEDDLIEKKQRIEQNTLLWEEYTLKLKNIINTAEFAGNSTVVDDLNDRIFKLKDELLKINYGLKNSTEESRLKKDYEDKNKIFGAAQASLNKAKEEYNKNNANTIAQFNQIYSELLSKSSYQSHEAYIDEDYMPFIDNREYKANSSDVPKRLMYYFTMLALSLKLNSVKHPRFLLIDTPEDSGIDTDHLNQNLALLNNAVAFGKQPDGSIKEYQVILTTGYGKFPTEFDEFVVERFSEKEGNFILKSRSASHDETNKFPDNKGFHSHE